MKVRSEATRNGQSLAVELDDMDGEIQFGENWDRMTLNERAVALQKHADKLVVVWMVRNELISREYGEQRLKELK